jgi:hypothetical protein
MALNQIFAPTTGKNRPRVVASGVVSGQPLLSGAEPAVALTDRGDAVKTIAVPGSALTSVTYKSGGASLAANEASLAFDGTFEFAVATAATNTDSGVAVYITSGGTLTLVSTGNTLFGYTDYPKGYRKEAGRAPVRIGIAR